MSYKTLGPTGLFISSLYLEILASHAWNQMVLEWGIQQVGHSLKVSRVYLNIL